MTANLSFMVGAIFGIMGSQSLLYLGTLSDVFRVEYGVSRLHCYMQVLR